MKTSVMVDGCGDEANSEKPSVPLKNNATILSDYGPQLMTNPRRVTPLQSPTAQQCRYWLSDRACPAGGRCHRHGPNSSR